MMRSLYSGVSGLKNHQTRMDVIGNNIANVNTAGYKTSRVVFQDIYSQMSKGASAPNGDIAGGTNSRQIGLGVNLAAIDVVHSSAATQRTDRELDLAIEGDGYFAIGMPSGEILYTRAGNFYMDEAGNLVTNSGNFVLGLQQTSYYTVPNTYDEDTGEVLSYGYVITDVGGNPVGAIPTAEEVAEMIKTLPGTNVTAHPYWAVDGTTGAVTPTADNPVYAIDDQTGEITIKDGYELANGIDPSLYVLKDSTAGVADDGTIDYTQYYALNNFSDSLKSSAMSKDSLTLLNLSGYNGIAIDDKGIISGLNAKSERETIGIIALATFTNTGGLEKRGNNLYAESVNTGEPVFTQAQVGAAGKVNPGGLEMSNVDLSTEFTDMIVTQRGFQANSRIITVSDTLLEELINLKR